MMKAVVLSIGTELTTGQQVDTNAAWLSAELTRLGADVVEHITVGDKRDAIREAIRRVVGIGDVVVATGGLGPTPDDLTRFALADALDAPLEESAEALAQIQSLFERWQRPWNDANRVQAMIPRGCAVIPNARGTAPGIHYHGDCEIFVLPGVPAEMKAMFTSAVVPAVKARTGGTRAHVARVQSFGLSEAKVGELLADLMTPDRQPLVGTSAGHGVIGIRVVARGASEAEARSAAQADIAEIHHRLGDAAYGSDDDALEGVIGKLLTDRGATLATAESCTGGLLAKRITDVPGSSSYFLRGYVTYADRSKTDLLTVPSDLIAEQGAVSEGVAEAMASGCRTAAGADYAVSITGVAGPGGGTPAKPVGLVYLGLAHAGGVTVKRLMIGDHLGRCEMRDRACSVALNLLRLHLLRSAH